MSTRSTPPNSSPQQHENLFVRLLPYAAMLLVAAIYLTTPAVQQWGFLSKSPSGYYGLQTEAFYHGQLHLRIATDPKLLTMENPYAGPQGAQRPHDMSFYKGKFYLYYGITPVVILYLPWRVLTGYYLNEAAGTNLFYLGGFLLACGWLLHARRRWFPEASSLWVAALVLVIGLSPPICQEIHHEGFYAVPIAAAYFCLMAALTAVYRAVEARTLARQAAWLGAASLAWGLSVGARPIYVLGLTTLMLPTFWLWWRSGPGSRWRWPGLRLFAAAIVPAALIGAALMVYNFMRFDSPVDFGIRFSMASGDLREARLLGPEFIPKNLYGYLLRPIEYIRYFPFFTTGDRPFGIVPNLTFATLAFTLPLLWFRREWRAPAWLVTGPLPLLAGLANLALLCLFFGGEERYLIDYVPPLYLAAATVALACSTRRLRLLRIAPALLIAYSLVTAFLLGLTHRPGAEDRHPLERLLNLPVALVEKWKGEIQGPVEMEVIFPSGQVGRTDPLVTTGNVSNTGDIISVRYIDDRHVQFQAFHIGAGGPVSEPVEVDFNVPHRLRIELGSLYPPDGHPSFHGWTQSEINRLRRRLRVELDGKPVLVGNMAVYRSTPDGVTLGTSRFNLASKVFGGRILSMRRLGIDRSEVAGLAAGFGPLRLTLRFPPPPGEIGMPLVATGRVGDGDLIYAQVPTPGWIRFGHDSWDRGSIVSASVPYDATQDHVVIIDIPPLHSPTENPAADRFRIIFNGQTVINTVRDFNGTQPDEVEVGFNTVGSSAAMDYFAGSIRKVERLPPLPPEPTPPRWSKLRVVVEFPPGNDGRAEPLLTTGRPGAADVLFVHYELDGRLRFGVDHWGIGAELGEPLALARGVPHLLEISTSALREGGPGAPLEVRLADGTVVFRPSYEPYVAKSEDAFIGRNDIGASSCAGVFSGRFLMIERDP